LPPDKPPPNKPKQIESIIKLIREDSIIEEINNNDIHNNNIISENNDKNSNENKNENKNENNNIDSFLDSNFSNVGNFDNSETITKKLEYKPNFRIDKIPIYPSVSKKLGQEGTISLLISLDNRGEVLSININKSTGYKLLDDSAIKTAKEWNYKQLIDGYTINYLVTTNIVFKLE